MLQTCSYDAKIYTLSKIHIKMFKIWKEFICIHEYRDTLYIQIHTNICPCVDSACLYKDGCSSTAHL
jgi:hypothetical protein